MSDIEKTLEDPNVTELPHDPDAGLSPEEKAKVERALLWKLDLTLMPWLCLLYLIAFLDRTNIGNAKIASLTKDVPMTTTQYNHTLTIFFIAYAVFEALANFLLKRFRPSIFLPITMVLWGACMLGMGFVHNWEGLMSARFFLGVTEAGLFPGINYYLSCWYKRNEFGIRAAIFFSAAALSGSFGGLLAAAIQNMNGLGGYPGWAWIFIIEGLLTIIVGFISFKMVHDFPAEAKFLSADDRARVLRRLREDKQASAGNEEFDIRYVWQAVKDWKTYCGCLVYMGPLMPLYSFSLFLPSIIANMGFTTQDSIIKNQLLSVPPYALATIVTIVVGFWSDRIGKRGIFNLILAPIGIAGFAMLIAAGPDRPAVQYAATFLGAASIYPMIPLTIAWLANNTEGVYKRGIVLGFVIGWANMNGVVSSNVFFNGPRYVEGHATIIGYLSVCSFLGSALLMYALSRENAKRRAGARDGWVSGLNETEVAMLGDNKPDFIYTI